MRTSVLISSLAIVLASAMNVVVASGKKLEWNFTAGKAVISQRGAEPTRIEKFSINQPIGSPLTLSRGDSLKLSMQLQVGSDPSVPHQAFLYMKQDNTGLETIFPLDIVEATAKAKLEVTQKDIPAALLASDSPLSLSLVIGCFTPTVKPLETDIGKLTLQVDAAGKAAAIKAIGEVVRYEKKPEIRHTFRPDPKSPPKIVTLVFVVAVLSCLGGLFGGWALLGANLSALPSSLKAAPISHPLFFGSILAFEGIFFMYYVKWNLLQSLAAMACVAPVAFLSGSKALTEFRQRRLGIKTTN